MSLEPKVTRPPFDDKAMLTLSEAACLLSGICTSRQDAEMMLALAIELGELRACVKQWDVEQWSAEKIPGYLSCRASFIARRDREGWLAMKGLCITTVRVAHQMLQDRERSEAHGPSRPGTFPPGTNALAIGLLQEKEANDGHRKHATRCIDQPGLPARFFNATGNG